MRKTPISAIDKFDIKRTRILIGTFLSQLNKGCQFLYLRPSTESKETNLPKWVHKTLHSIKSPLALEFYDSVIDFYAEGFIENLHKHFPSCKTSTLRLIRYLYAGFEVETILFLLDWNKRRKVSDAKSALKKRIIESSNLSNKEKDFVLKRLKMQKNTFSIG